jgi:hypothetical protein
MDADLRLERDGGRCVEPPMGVRRPKPLWPWAWLALEGVATVGWLFAISWGAVALARWLLG